MARSITTPEKEDRELTVAFEDTRRVLTQQSFAQPVNLYKMELTLYLKRYKVKQPMHCYLLAQNENLSPVIRKMHCRPKMTIMQTFLLWLMLKNPLEIMYPYSGR